MFRPFFLEFVILMTNYIRTSYHLYLSELKKNSAIFVTLDKKRTIFIYYCYFHQESVESPLLNRDCKTLGFLSLGIATTHLSVVFDI